MFVTVTLIRPDFKINVCINAGSSKGFIYLFCHSIYMFNIYIDLVMANQNQPLYEPLVWLAELTLSHIHSKCLFSVSLFQFLTILVSLFHSHSLTLFSPIISSSVHPSLWLTAAATVIIPGSQTERWNTHTHHICIFIRMHRS